MILLYREVLVQYKKIIGLMPIKFFYTGGVLLNYRKFYKYALLLLDKNQQKFFNRNIQKTKASLEYRYNHLYWLFIYIEVICKKRTLFVQILYRTWECSVQKVYVFCTLYLYTPILSALREYTFGRWWRRWNYLLRSQFTKIRISQSMD